MLSLTKMLIVDWLYLSRRFRLDKSKSAFRRVKNRRSNTGKPHYEYVPKYHSSITAEPPKTYAKKFTHNLMRFHSFTSFIITMGLLIYGFIKV